MNIVALNQLGHQALVFAFSMFWQSSLLIGVIWIVDFALRRKLRASVRYALWVVMVVKLVTPPSLAVPTGVGWWLFTETPVPAQKSEFVVDYNVGGNVAPAALGPPTVGRAPQIAVSENVWILAGCGGISLALLGWLAFRWRQVARDVRQATPAPQGLDDIQEQARRASGLRVKVQLLLTERLISPSVCGLLRPVILIPRVLAEELSAEQMQAVLVHELIHVKRGDIWVNFAQALLQIGYWWHPFVWFGNVQMRRVREEAVDEAVMLALAERSESYAPTLLEVAKLAFGKPQPSLGLIGILESRSDLKRRIERLLSFKASQKAGLTLLSFVGIAAFIAVAVPMGVAPVSTQSFEVASSATASESTRIIEPKLEVAASGATSNSPGVPQLRVETRLIEISVDPTSEPAGSALSILPLNSSSNVLAAQTQAVAELRAKFEQPERLRLVTDGNATVTKILSSEEAQLLIKRLEQRSGTDMLRFPVSTTPAGRKAHLAINDMKTCVTGVKGEVNDGHVSFEYLTEKFALGPVLNFETKLEGDDRTITMDLQSHVLEFLGYDEGKLLSLSAPGGKPLTAVPPFPRFRLIELGAKASVRDGQTLMLAGPVYYNTVIMKDKVPLLGDIPLFGRFFRHESKSQVKRHLILLVTPIVEGTGRPVHGDL